MSRLYNVKLDHRNHAEKQVSGKPVGKSEKFLSLEIRAWKYRPFLPFIECAYFYGCMINLYMCMI